MSDNATDTRRIDWPACCPCTQIFRAFRMSVQHSQLFLSLLTVLALSVVGVTCDWLTPEKHRVQATRDRGVLLATELTAYVDGSYSDAAVRKYIAATAALPKTPQVPHSVREGVFKVFESFVRRNIAQTTDALLSARWLSSSDGKVGFFASLLNFPIALWWAISYHPIFSLVFGLLSLAVMAIFGGAAYRVAGLQATRGDTPGFSEAVAFAQSRFLTFLLAPAIPWFFLLAFGVALLVGGWIAGTASFLSFLAGIIWIVPLLFGLAMALILIIAVGVWPLMYPAIGVDSADAFDAASRTAGYVYDRPWKTPLYFLLAAGYGAVCVMVVKFLARLSFWFAHAWIGAGMNRWQTTAPNGRSIGMLDIVWNTPGADGQPFWGRFNFNTGSTLLNGTAYLTWFWTMLLVLLIAGFVFSFFCSSTTLIYLLLRRDVDGTDLEEAWVEEEHDAMFAEPPAAAAAATDKPERSTSLPVMNASPPPDAVP